MGRAFQPVCPCGNDEFQIVSTVICTAGTSGFEIADDGSVDIEYDNSGSNVCWDSDELKPAPFECTSCGRAFTEVEFKALPEQADIELAEEGA